MKGRVIFCLVFRAMCAVVFSWRKKRTWGGGEEEAVERMSTGLKEHLDTGAIVTHTYHIALLAEALAELGDHERGLTLLADGLDLIREHGDRRWEADLYRVRGDILAAKPSPDSSGARRHTYSR